MRKSRRKIDHEVVRRLAGALLPACVFAFFVTSLVLGEEAGRGDTDTVREILVPFEDLHVILQGDKERVLLSREEYDALMAKAKISVEESAPRPAVPVSAEYHVSVQEDRAVIEGTLKVEVVEKGLHAVPLALGGIGLRSIVMDAQPAALGRAADGHLSLFVEGVGAHDVSIDAVTPLVTGAARQVLNFQLPTPSSTRLFVKVPGDVEVRSGAAVISRVFDDAAAETRFELLPEKNQVSIVMSLNSRLKRRDRVVVARSVLVDEVTQAYERLHATVSFDILHRAVDELSITIPPAFEVTDVSSPHLSKWAVQRGNDEGVLDIQLRSETVGTVVLNISAVRSSPTLEDWRLPIFEPRDVISHASVVGLLVEERLEVQNLTSEGLVPIDAIVIKAALPKTVLDGEVGAARVRPVTAFYSPNSTYSLSAEFIRRPAAFLVTANFVMQVRDAGLEINGGLSLLPKEEKLFALDLLAPAGWQVTAVTAPGGTALPFESYDAEAGSRIRIRLPKGVAVGHGASIAFVARHIPDGWFDSWNSTSLPFPVFSVPGSERDRGAIAVAAGDDMVVRPGTVANVSPLDQNEKRKFGLSDIPTSLAYSYRGHPYSAEVLVERMTPRLTAETYSFFRLERDVAATRYEIIYDVTLARARKASFSLPASAPSSLSVTGLNGTEVKEYSSVEADGRRIWSATLADARRGSIHLAVDMVLPMPETKYGNWELPVVLAENVTYQSGMIAVEGNAELDVRVLKHPRKVDVGELVDADYAPGRRLLGAFNFVGNPQTVEIGVSRRSPCFIPPAIVERAELAATLSADGKSQSAMRFLVRSQAQFVEVRLPPDSVLWSASVDGESSKPRREGQSVLISLPSRGNAVRDVQVVYETPIDGLKFWEEITLDAPRLFFHSSGLGAGNEVPVADLKWDVFLPNGYEVGRSTGSVVSHSIVPPRPAAIEVAQWLYETAGGINIRRGFVGGCTKAAGHIAASSEMSRGRRKYGYVVDEMVSAPVEELSAQTEEVVLFDAARPAEDPSAQIQTKWQERQRAASKRESERLGIINKMKAIKIPEIDFRQANINDVMKFLQDASIEFDEVSKEGETKGLNMILNLAAGPQPVPQSDDPFVAATAAAGDDVPLITFSARYLDLYEALRIVTEVANLKFKISESGVIMVVPFDAPLGEIQTRTYVMPPSVAKRIEDMQTDASRRSGRSTGDFIALDASPGGSGKGNWKAFFKELGVEWPAGSSIKYVPSLGKVVASNTGDNLEVLDGTLNEIVGRPSGGQRLEKALLGERLPEEPFGGGKKDSLWALKGISSLNIDLTSVGAGITFRSLGVDPLLQLRLIHQRRTNAFAWAIAGIVFVVGIAFTHQGSSRKCLYVAGVMLLTMAIPVLPQWTYVSLVMNYAFYAACWLIPYYFIVALVHRFILRSTASVLARSSTTMLLIAFSLAVLIPGSVVIAKEARVSEPYVVQVAPPPDPVKVPADAIVVPYRDEVPGDASEGRIMIPYKRFRELWHLAYGKEEDAKKPPVPYALAGAEYRADLLDGETLRVHGKLTIEVYGPTHAEVPLPLSGGVITAALLDGKPAKLTSGALGTVQGRNQSNNAPHQQSPQPRQQDSQVMMNSPVQSGQGLVRALAILYLPGEGRHVLDITIDMKLARRGGWRVAEGLIPSAPAALLSLKVPDAQTDVSLGYVADRRSYKTKTAGETIETAVQPGGMFRIMWRPKVSEGETDITLTASSAALFDIREDQLDLVWDLHLMFRRGERDSFTVRVPGDYVVEKVEGENVRGWAIDDATGQAGPGSRELKVDLLKRSVKKESFTLYLWKPGPVAAGEKESIQTPVVAVPEAMRHTGKLTIRRSPLLDVRSLAASGLRRTDLQAKNYPGNLDKAPDESPLGIRPYESYEFVAVPFEVKLAVAPNRADLSARVNSILRIAEDEHRLESRIDLMAKNRPLHLVRIELPSRFELEDVNAPGEYEWTVRERNGKNELNIYFAAGQQERIPIILKATSDVQEEGQSAEMPSLAVLGVDEQSGDIVIQADPAYDVRAEKLAGLEAVLMKRVHSWLASGQRPLARLAFHYRKTGYRGNLMLARRKADVTCHTISNVRVTDKAIEETILINFSIRNAGIRSVEFRMPAHLKDARINAPLLREKTITPVDGGKEVMVSLRLQDEVMREFSVLVESDRLLSSDAQTVTVPSILTGRTDRQYITLENAGRDEIVVERTSGLDPLGRQQKEWATVAPLIGGAMTTAYIVASESQAVELTFNTTQRVAVETAGARIGLSQCVLIIDGEGAYRGEQTYHVDNQTEQFLETELPEGASLWTAVVAGELVKPVAGDSDNPRHVRVPLVKTAAGDLDYTVLLKYAGKLGAIRRFKETDFPLLRTLNVNVELTQLELRLPRTHRWGYFDGSMRRVTQAGDFEAGLLSYQTKLAKRLVKTLQYGNVFEKARAVSNLKGVQKDLQVFQESLNINPANDSLNFEVSNAGDVLGDAAIELEKAEEQEEEQTDGLDNRFELNARFARQSNTLSRNKVLDVDDNWGDGQKEGPGDVSNQTVFNHAWLGANGLVMAEAPGEDDKVTGQRVQEFGGQFGKGWKKSAKAPVAVEQKAVEFGWQESDYKPQAKGKGQRALASRYKAKLEQQQQQEMQQLRQFRQDWEVLDPFDNNVDAVQAAANADLETVQTMGGTTIGGFGLAGGGGTSSYTAEPVAGTGLASLDVNLPAFDPNRWARYRFTTPLGEARVTARSISESALAGVKRFGLVVTSLLLLFLARRLVIGVRIMQGDVTGSAVMHHLPNILIIFGVIDLLAGILPVAAFWALVIGIGMKIRRRYLRWRQLWSA